MINKKLSNFNKNHTTNMNSSNLCFADNASPEEIVQSLDKYVVGQKDAKRAVAIALRNRWRRSKLDANLQREVMPNNILMIGPTGVGKTEIARRLALLVSAPFLKVEATKFTEVGYVGRDVEQIVRDLVEISIANIRNKRRIEVLEQAEKISEKMIFDLLVQEDSSAEDQQELLENIKNGSIDHLEIEIDSSEGQKSPMHGIDLPNGAIGMINVSEIIGNMGKGFANFSGFTAEKKKKKMNVKDAKKAIISEEVENLLDQASIVEKAIRDVEEYGIVFIDEIDKLSTSGGGGKTDISREGVQRDLLPIIEGTTVSCKHGSVKTDHILFIASGAFHLSKPSDLLPELQGRLPIRVELHSLSQEDFIKILTETEVNLLMQYRALIATEGVELEFSQDAIEEIARAAAETNMSIENIGARRLRTIIEKVLDEISFDADKRSGEKIVITRDLVKEKIQHIVSDKDLSRFIL